ncbi:hypothetical protein ACQP1P_27735 [Dactylosporangium sp. CA-052675]|uniref:hypothetical protein n=1 Tax=Dactylosporangium sp. CA-052675 TaxID=3239927 RepID=UPI003D8C0C99
MPPVEVGPRQLPAQWRRGKPPRPELYRFQQDIDWPGASGGVAVQWIGRPTPNVKVDMPGPLGRGAAGALA